MQINTEIPAEETRFTRFARARLDGLLAARSVLTAVQPMVDLESSELVGHELLARPRGAGVSHTARTLLQIAESQGLAAELSRRLRSAGLAQTAARIVPGRLFLNTHPAELDRPGDLVDSLRQLGEHYPEVELTLEIPEHAPLELDTYVELRHQLRALGIGVAFDDFGTGLSRLLELSAAPPDYVKFARRMVRGIDQQVRFRERVVHPIIDFIHSMGALPIAVGVETTDELATCRDLGFTWAQGFLVGRPWTVAA